MFTSHSLMVQPVCECMWTVCTTDVLKFIGVVMCAGTKALVVSGHAVSLHALRMALAGMTAAAGEDQSRLPFSQRKPFISCTYLPVTAPFHSPLLTSAIPLILADCKRLGTQTSSPLHFAPCSHVFRTFAC
jgi:malonyl CoA-acyl carrier protein transacylase